MKKLIGIIAIIVASLALFGCGEPDSPLEDKRVATNGSQYNFEEVTINGKKCILLEQSTYYGYKVITFDCDWGVTTTANG